MPDPNRMPDMRACMIHAILLLSLAGCSSNTGKPKVAPAPVARADIQGFLPNTVKGTAAFADSGSAGLAIRVEVDGLLPNREYAIHIHERGNCSSPDSTGDHFDPGHSGKHGSPGGSPGSHHSGDLPNLTTDGHGHGHLEYTTNALGIGNSDFSVLGRSIVIDAEKDDFSTQPSGGAGPKIACGVIRIPG